MTDDDMLSPARAVRLLRAKVSELEAELLNDYDPDLPTQFGPREATSRIVSLGADLALVADILASHIESIEARLDAPG
jgi:hypothetical protein